MCYTHTDEPKKLPARLRVSFPVVRFSKHPKLFGAISGAIIFYVLKTFPSMTFSRTFCIKFALSYLEIRVKDQLFRISGSSFDMAFRARNVFGCFEKRAAKRIEMLGNVMPEAIVIQSYVTDRK